MDRIRSDHNTWSLCFGHMVKSHVLGEVPRGAVNVSPRLLVPVAQFVWSDTDNVPILIMEVLYPPMEIATRIGCCIRDSGDPPDEWARIAAQRVKISIIYYSPCQKQKSLPTNPPQSGF